MSQDINNTAFSKTDLILARIGEITLKGMNRKKFEQRLIGNLKRRLRPLGSFSISQKQSQLWIEAANPEEVHVAVHDVEALLQAVTSVFGIVSASPVWRVSGELPELKAAAIAYVADILAAKGPQSFKVESRRGNKQFPLTSPEISNEIGGDLITAFPEQLTVDVHKPDFILYIEVRDQLYLYSRIVKGQRGLPVGTSGKGMLLLSGGIDSPVAGYLMASRGMEISAVYFHAHPFTSEQAKEKVIDLARQLSVYSGRLTLHIVHFTDIQLALRDNSPSEMMTIIMRRMMMRIARELALQNGCKALITGESLGQVASQTLEGLICTEDAVDMLVFRPLIGTDKDDTVNLARRIGTFETSILPYEDCCTVFVDPHPVTHPSLEQTYAAEARLNIPELVANGLANVEVIRL
ncbi:MAG: tRNA 4-thiouridine(8) synthase ThiI [Ruminococcaceae bacterium]|nr:tRNA 4-thiouridine(8) synthase ThiI [Oscillospiraceae bacterium]